MNPDIENTDELLATCRIDQLPLLFLKINPMHSSSMYLNARIKLRNLHLLEWHSLAGHQQSVWRLIREETARKLSLCANDEVACLHLRREQAMRLTKLATNQREVREQIKTRHQHEFFLLEQTLTMPEKKSNRDTTKNCT